MNIWNKFPLIRLLIPFVIGILFGIKLTYKIPYLLLISAFIFVLLVFFSWTKKTRHLEYWGILLSVFMLLLGFLSIEFRTGIRNPKHFSNYSKAFYHAKIVEPVLVKEKTVKVIVEINELNCKNKSIPTLGKALLYIRKDKDSENLSYGDIVMFSSNLEKLTAPKNPEEFDYRKYLSYHNIYHQTFVNPQQWKLIEKAQGFDFFKIAQGYRDLFLRIFDKYKIKGEELAVVSALVLGYKENLTDELSQSYSSAGAMHVLAVSGLHVGIIYIIINSLLSFLTTTVLGRIVKAILVISFLWFYAALTGLSPSVMRAVTMFTAVVIGDTLGHKSSIYNTLAVSAILLLLYDPYLIMSVGFQLSYLAVIGIVGLQPKIYNLVYIPNWLLDKIWVISSVSIAAQIATFPLGLYYFHQFPNYFLISNLIVIPFATLILYFGLLLLLVSPIALIGNLVTWILEKLVFILNYSVKLTEILPYAITQEINISESESIMIYLSVLSIIFLFIYRKYVFLITFLSITLFLIGVNIIEKQETLDRKELVVYNIKGSTGINFVEGDKCFLFADKKLLTNETKQRFHIKHHWWKLNIKEQNKYSLTSNLRNNSVMKNGHFISFKNTTSIMLLDKASPKYFNNTINKLKLDYLVVTNNYYFEPNRLKGISYKKVIFDSSNSSYKIEKGIEKCKAAGVKYHSVIHSGAFIAEL